MTNPFAQATPQELLTTLENAGRAPSLDLIRACMNRRGELTPGLLDMLAAPSDPTWDNDDPRWYAPIHAGHLLIHFREPQAIPIFMRLLREPDNDSHVEWFEIKLASYGMGILPPLAELLNDADAPEYARAMSCETFKQIAVEFPTERARVMQILREALPPLDANNKLVIPKPRPDKPNLVWTDIAVALAELSDFSSRPQIERLYRDGWMDESIMGDEKKYLHLLLHPEPLRSEPFNLLETYEHLGDEKTSPLLSDPEFQHRLSKQLSELNASKPETDVVDATVVSSSIQESAKIESQTSARQIADGSQTYRRAQPKIGRNDPCYCGSGKKFKHCHGK